MNTTNHSSLPLKSPGDDIIQDADGLCVAYVWVPGAPWEANRDMIVHRVNCHDDLVDALRDAEDSLSYFDHSEFWKPEHRESLKTIHAALAKAEKLTAEKGA